MITLQAQEHDVFKALSEPIRIRIMVLLTGGELCVCDLMAVLKLPQSTVSRHMNRLKVSGLVVDRRAGKWIHYSIDSRFVDSFPELNGLFRALRAKEPYCTDSAGTQEYLKTKSCDDEIEGNDHG